ncbi:hypothetical protein TNCV_3459321 [Trichonephila clavipes]|nr:hypothetical protein TNCV_3459321 [Trichonephila clavipes]
MICPIIPIIEILCNRAYESNNHHPTIQHIDKSPYSSYEPDPYRPMLPGLKDIINITCTDNTDSTPRWLSATAFSTPATLIFFLVRSIHPLIQRHREGGDLISLPSSVIPIPQCHYEVKGGQYCPSKRINTPLRVRSKPV